MAGPVTGWLEDPPNPMLADIIAAGWREDQEDLDRLFTSLPERDRLRLGRLIRIIAQASIRHAKDTKPPTLPGEVIRA